MLQSKKTGTDIEKFKKMGLTAIKAKLFLVFVSEKNTKFVVKMI
jgi:hypothetical protein